VGKKIDDKKLNEAGCIAKVQKDQLKKASDRASQTASDLDRLEEINTENNKRINNLIEKATSLNIENKKNQENNTNYYELGKKLIEDNSKESSTLKSVTNKHPYNKLDTIEVTEGDWKKYLENIQFYANKHNIDLEEDPFEELLSEEDKQIIAKRLSDDYSLTKANCDKYDYMIAAFCGVVAGVIDVFFVGMPGNSKLGNWTDKKVDEFIVNIARIKKRSPFIGENKVADAISYLESKYKVNYDQNTGKAAGELLGMSTRNHHIKSLGHSPSLIGLLFSVLDQFNNTSHFLDNGRLITFDTKKMKLEGGNFFSKLFAGFCNWVGHIISDMAGSSSTRGKLNSRGSGIPMPLFELFQSIGKGSFKIYGQNDKMNAATEMSFADVSVKVFEEGYDARFAATQAIPVIFNEIIIRLLWYLKSKFYYNKSWKESIPLGRKPELRRMLLTGHGVLCLIDGMDAAVKSDGQILLFILRLNFTAWKRLAFSGMLEVSSIYRKNAINLAKLEKDLEVEWEILYG